MKFDPADHESKRGAAKDVSGAVLQVTLNKLPDPLVGWIRITLEAATAVVLI